MAPAAPRFLPRHRIVESVGLPQRPVDRIDAVLAAVCGLVALAVYSRTVIPEILPYDGGEFQVLGVSGGHAHVTGYSIYLVMLRLFAALPIGEPILRATVFSAVMGGVAVSLVYLCGRVASGWRVGGVALAAAWGGAATVWSQSIQAEVYTTASVFTAGVLWFVLTWLRDRAWWRLMAAGILGGASLGVHGSVGLFAPGIGCALVMAGLDRRSVAGAVAGVVIGIGLFLTAFWVVDRQVDRNDVFTSVYLPWAEAFDSTPEQLAKPAARLAFLLDAKQWQKSMFADPVRTMPMNAYWYLRVFRRDFTWLWMGLAGFGLGVMVRRARPLAALIVVGLVVHHLYTFNYAIPDVYVFFIPAFLYVGVAGAVGLGALLNAARLEPARWAMPVAVAVAVAAAFGAQPVAKLRDVERGESGELVRDQPSNLELTRQREAMEKLIAILPPDALVATDWELLYRLIYLARRAGRTDLKFIEGRPWGIEHMPMADYHARIAQLEAQRPLVFSSASPTLVALGYTGDPLARVASQNFWRVR